MGQKRNGYTMKVPQGPSIVYKQGLQWRGWEMTCSHTLAWLLGAHICLHNTDGWSSLLQGRYFRNTPGPGPKTWLVNLPEHSSWDLWPASCLPLNFRALLGASASLKVYRAQIHRAELVHTGGIKDFGCHVCKYPDTAWDEVHGEPSSLNQW